MKRMMNSVKLKELIERAGSTDEFSVFQVRFRGIERNTTKISTLWYAYKIAKFTDIFSSDVRAYLFEQPKTYIEVSNEFNVSVGTLKNKIHRQTKKYAEIIGCDLFEEIKNQTISEESCKLLLDTLKRYFDRQEKVKVMIEDKFYEDIFTGRKLDVEFNDIDEEDFILARDIFARFSKPANNFLMSNLDDKVKDYIVYLINTPENHLVEKDKIRKANIYRYLRLN